MKSLQLDNQTVKLSEPSYCLYMIMKDHCRKVFNLDSEDI